MTNYLSKFKSSVSQNQFNRLVKLLEKQKQQGQFNTIEQFKTRVNLLMKEMFEKRLTPLFSLFEAKSFESIDSETFNYMLDRIQDDLEISFYETLVIDEVQRAHASIIKDVVLKNLKHGIADLEKQVATYELVANSDYNFDKSIFSNFSGAETNRLQRNDVNSSTYFFDPRLGSSFPSKYDSLVDQTGKYLSLPYKSNGYINIVGIRQIFDSVAKASEKIVTPENMYLENLIDNTKNTFWSQLYLYETDTCPNYIISKLELDLGGAQEIDFIEIEPALLYSIELTNIYFIGNDNTLTTLSNVSQMITNNRAKILFRKISAKKIILEFKNETSTYVDYKTEEKSEGDLSLTLNPALYEQLGIRNEPTLQEYSGKQFQIGFDNIKIGLASFESKGIYVSKPLKLKTPIKLIGLKTKELRPGSEDSLLTSISPMETTYDAGDDVTFYSSIEYWVIRNSYDDSPTPNLIAMDYFPILPIGTTRINHERLLLNSKYSTSTLTNDSGELIFYTTYASGNIKVYRNGTLLTKVSLESEDGWMNESELTNVYPNSGKPMKYGIRITQPRSGDIYTVSYTPIVSNVQSNSSSEINHLVIDLVGDLTARSYTDQVTINSNIKKATVVGHHELFLSIILRRNTASEALTPVIKEYLLAVNSEDLTKFEEEGINV